MIPEAEMKSVEEKALEDRATRFATESNGVCLVVNHQLKRGYKAGARDQRELMLEREKVLLEKAIIQSGIAFSIQKALLEGVRDAIWVLVDNSDANANSIAVEKLESAYAKYQALKGKA